MALSVIFMGTPDFAVPTLSALAGAGHDIAAVYTQPPRAAGRRGLAPTPSPVQREAERLGIEVLTPVSLKEADAQATFRGFGADVAVVVAYGLLLPVPVLEAPRFGCLNGHASLLPRWRGAAPIQRAVMAGDAETGVMVMRMEEGLDTGPVCLGETVPIGPDATAGDLHDTLMAVCARLMTAALARLEQGALAFVPQAAEGALYAKKVEKAETRVDWRLQAGAVHNHIRGLSPFPGAWCEVDAGGRGERLKLLRAHVAEGAGAPGEILDDRPTVACGSGAVRLVEVQRAGGKPVTGQEFLRGARLEKGMKLS